MNLNILQKWEIKHRRKILSELEGARIEIIIENIPKIIRETSFEIRSKKFPDKCPYYKTGKSCHPEIKDLNCFLCACPQYEPEKIDGGCKINSKKGKWTYHPNLPKGKVWDCSDCNYYHTPSSVEKFLKENIEKLKTID